MISVGVNPVPPPKYGGIETVVANLSSELPKLGHKVLVYAPGLCPLAGVKHIQTLAEPLISFDKGNLVVNPPEHIEAVKRALLDQYQPGDIIHFHNQTHASDMEALIKTQAHLCETAHWKTVGLSANIIYPSQALREYIGKPGELVYHGVDLSHWGVDTDANIDRNSLLYVGRITQDKGLDIALEACQRLGISLKVAGPMPTENNSFGHEILKHVEYLGEKTPDELRPLYNHALAMIYMTQYCEPFGLAVVEAMACGCPVLVSGNGATCETVIHGKTGFITPDIETLVEGITKINDIKRADCVEQAGHFGLEKQVQRQEYVYQSLFGE